jgi:enoyl-CoA hydratase/carnithine racemase
MPKKTVSFQKLGNVIVIYVPYLNNSSAKITGLTEVITELCDEIIGDETIRVVVLTGTAETSFSLETHFSDSLSGAHEEPWIKIRSLGEPMARIDQPVIAAINGDAIGQGLELALACDIRIASETSRFGLPQIKSGIIPWDGGTQRLSRLVGKGKALEMILTGEMIKAQEALRIGLVNRIVPPDKLMAVAMDMAKEMASKGPIALKYTKEAIYKGMDMTLEQGLHLEADLYLLIHTTKDRTEGIKAFQEKRTPKFEGK